MSSSTSGSASILRRREPADHAKLGAVRAQRVHRLRRRRRHDSHPHAGIHALERDGDLRQEIGGGTPDAAIVSDPVGGWRNSVTLRAACASSASARSTYSARNARGRQLGASGPALDQPHSQPPLDVRDVLGHRRLTDTQLARGG